MYHSQLFSKYCIIKTTFSWNCTTIILILIFYKENNSLHKLKYKNIIRKSTEMRFLFGDRGNNSTTHAHYNSSAFLKAFLIESILTYIYSYLKRLSEGHYRAYGISLLFIVFTPITCHSSEASACVGLSDTAYISFNFIIYL